MKPRSALQSKTWHRLSVGCLIAWGLSSGALAQYRIDWHTSDGGGGTSTGSIYTGSGTIGQPDAGTLSGGSYTLQGGFWAVVAAVQTPGAPLLTIFRTATNAVLVCWPSPSPHWSLQQNTEEISSGNWTNATAPIQDDGVTKWLLVSPPTGSRFYRLFKPVGE